MKKLFAIILALTLIASLAACGQTGQKNADAKSEGVMTYAEYAAAELDSQVVIEAYVQAKQAYSAEYGNTSLYLQDQDGGYFVYRIACSSEEYAKLAEGTKLKVSGYKSEWAGEVEIIDASFEVESGTWKADALDVTDLLGTDALAEHQNQKVTFKGMTVEPSGEGAAFLYNWDGSGSEGNDLYFNVSKNGATFNFTVESDLCGSGTDVYEAVKGLSVGDTIDVEGFLYWYEGANPHITSVTPAK